MIASSLGICTTGTKRKAEKIDIYFEDKIKKKAKNTKMTLFPWIRIDELKKQLARDKYRNHLSWSDLRLFYKNIELTPNNKRFFDFGVDPDSIIVIKKYEPDYTLEFGIINPYQIFDVVPDSIENLLLEVQSGLNNGKKPKLAEEGTSGTYFLENHMKKVVAIFKPFNEEPYAEKNPRNFVGQTGSQGIRKGILSGESATREVAAYLLDQSRFHGVPETTYIQFFHPTFIEKDQISNPIASDPEKMLNKQSQLKTKHGSLQCFVESNDIVGNMGSNQFDVEQIHKIGILDIRILNCDRNEANILVKKMMIPSKDQKGGGKKYFKLIPIDHGLSFPDNFQIYDYEMVWMSYRQASQPFSEKSLNFIQSIDPVKDCQRLKQKLGFREICLRNFRIAQTFLKRMAREGFTLLQIGEMMYRKGEDEDCSEEETEQKEEKENKENEGKSDLQKIVNQAENIYFLIKENSLKSTINFQLQLTKPKKLEQSMPELTENKILLLKQHSKKSETSLEKTTKQTLELENLKKPLKSSLSKARNVSLPNLKIKKRDSKAGQNKRKNLRKREVQKTKVSKKRKQEEWDQVFFHYFEQFLERFIQEKHKKHRQASSRSRLMSEDINQYI